MTRRFGVILIALFMSASAVGLPASSARSSLGQNKQSPAEAPTKDRSYTVAVGEVEYSVVVVEPDNKEVLRVKVTSSDDPTPRLFEDWTRGPYRVFRGSTMIYERIVGGLKAEDWPVTAGSFKTSLAALPTAPGFPGSEAERDIRAFERDVMMLTALRKKADDRAISRAATEMFVLFIRLRHARGEQMAYPPEIVVKNSAAK